MTTTRKHLGAENLERREVFSVSLPHVAELDTAAAVPAAVVESSEMSRVTMIDMIEHESNDTQNSANKLPLDADTGVRLQGKLDAKDVDYFAFKPQVDSHLRLATQGGDVEKLQVMIEDAKGNAVFTETANPAVNNVKLEGGKVYFLRLEGTPGQSMHYKAELVLNDARPVGPLAGAKMGSNGTGPIGQSRGNETVVIDEVEGNDTRVDAQLLPLSMKQDVAVRGTADGAKDTDYFKFQVTANAYLNLDMISASANGAHVWVEDATGNVVFKTTASAQDRVDSQTVKLNQGKYFLGVKSADVTGGKYEIQLGLERPAKSDPLMMVQDAEPTRRTESLYSTTEKSDATAYEAYDFVLANGAW